MNTFSVVPSPKVSYHEHILSCTITKGKLSKIKVNPFQTNGKIHKSAYDNVFVTSIVNIEGSPVIISNIYCIFYLKIDLALANSVECLHKYLVRGIHKLNRSYKWPPTH